MEYTSTLEAFTGGCQCGAIRFAVAAGPAHSTVCHCRMCQRATGNAFAPLIEVPKARVRITGTPATFASSNLAERGFCATCGTPLFYRGLARDSIEFMAGSLDDPTLFAPIRNHGIEARLRWPQTLADLPGRETFFTEGETLTSHQSSIGS